MKTEEITFPAVSFESIDDPLVVLNPDTGEPEILIYTPLFCFSLRVNDSQLESLGRQIKQFFEGSARNSSQPESLWLAIKPLSNQTSFIIELITPTILLPIKHKIKVLIKSEK